MTCSYAAQALLRQAKQHVASSSAAQAKVSGDHKCEAPIRPAYVLECIKKIYQMERPPHWATWREEKLTMRAGAASLAANCTCAIFMHIITFHKVAAARIGALRV